MLPSFVVSCQSVEDADFVQLPPLASSKDYIYIPVKRIIFDYSDKKKWRFITQKTEYIDGKNMQSLSSMWIFDFMPMEIIVLDNPDILNPFVFDFQEDDGIYLRKTNVFLPFKETTESNDLDELLPICKETEFRAIVRILSNLKYIGIQEVNKNGFDEDYVLRHWFSLGEVLCLSKIKS